MLGTEVHAVHRAIPMFPKMIPFSVEDTLILACGDKYNSNVR